jgi:hypothetical protein
MGRSFNEERLSHETRSRFCRFVAAGTFRGTAVGFTTGCGTILVPLKSAYLKNLPGVLKSGIAVWVNLPRNSLSLALHSKVFPRRVVYTMADGISVFPKCIDTVSVFNISCDGE